MQLYLHPKAWRGADTSSKLRIPNQRRDFRWSVCAQHGEWPIMARKRRNWTIREEPRAPVGEITSPQVVDDHANSGYTRQLTQQPHRSIAAKMVKCLRTRHDVHATIGEGQPQRVALNQQNRRGPRFERGDTEHVAAEITGEHRKRPPMPLAPALEHTRQIRSAGRYIQHARRSLRWH